jgi:hypothetical protein
MQCQKRQKKGKTKVNNHQNFFKCKKAATENSWIATNQHHIDILHK